MALTAYAGVTEPTPVINHGQYYGDWGFVNAATAIPVVGSFDTILVGDRFVACIVVNSATATVSTVVINDTSTVSSIGLVFTKLTSARFGNVGVEIWGSAAVTVQPTSSTWALAVTNSAAVPAGVIVTQWRNCSGYGGTFTNNGSAGTVTTWSLTSPPVTTQNAVVLDFIAANTTNTNTTTRNTPSILQSKRLVQNNVATPAMNMLVSYSQVEGAGVTPSASGTFGTTTAWAGLGIVLLGPTVSLDDLTYLVREDGVLLNNPSNALPIYDVAQVTGLDDSTVNNSISAIDGADGSYVDAKFLSGKTVIIDGTIFTAVPTDEVIIDNLKKSCRPTQLSTGIPFFFKLPTYQPRVLMVKPLGLKSTFDRDRALGKITYQVQLASADARAYSPGITTAQNTHLAAGATTTYNLAITQSGNIESYPKIYFNLYGSEGVGTTFTFTSDVWGQYQANAGSVVITVAAGLTVGAYCLDLGARKLTLLGGNSQTATTADTDMSSYITTRQWFGLIPGVINTLKLIRPIITDEGFYVVSADAWR